MVGITGVFTGGSPVTFGKWIIGHLDSIGVSQYQLEIDSNLGKGSIFRWSHGIHYPRMDSFMKVINQLSIYTQRSRESLLIEALSKIEVKR